MLIPTWRLNPWGFKVFFFFSFNELTFPEGFSVRPPEAWCEDGLVLIELGAQGLHRSGLN